MVAFKAMMPKEIRQNMLGRATPYADMLKGLRIPVLVTHWRKDEAVVAPTGEYTVRTAPGVQLSIYEGFGQFPFWEAQGGSTPSFWLSSTARD